MKQNFKNELNYNLFNFRYLFYQSSKPNNGSFFFKLEQVKNVTRDPVSFSNYAVSFKRIDEHFECGDEEKLSQVRSILR